MKNETARREIESLDYYLQNHTNDYSEESHTAMMMAIDALRNSEKPNKWIPVSEKLPGERILEDGWVEPSDHVLVQMKSGLMYVSRYWNRYKYKGVAWMDLSYPTTDEVVAWMPLPKPYEEKEE